MANIGTDILGLPTTVGGLSGDEWVPIVQGGTTKRTQVDGIGLGTITQFFPAAIEYVMMGGTEIVPLGIQGTGLVVPFDCGITEAVVTGSSPVGSVIIDIWKCTDSVYDGGLTHPVVADSITGGSPLTIVVGSKEITTSLPGWTVDLNEGDVLWYNIVSVAVFTSVTVTLKVTRVIP